MVLNVVEGNRVSGSRKIIFNIFRFLAWLLKLLTAYCIIVKCNDRTRFGSRKCSAKTSYTPMTLDVVSSLITAIFVAIGYCSSIYY